MTELDSQSIAEILVSLAETTPHATMAIYPQIRLLNIEDGIPSVEAMLNKGAEILRDAELLEDLLQLSARLI